MKSIGTILLNSIYKTINPQKKDNTFQIFGLDYIIDENFNPLLIKVVPNPDFEIKSTIQARLIPNLIENIIRIAIDPIFFPPVIENESAIKLNRIPENIFEKNRFELIFDQLYEANYLKKLNQTIDIPIYEFENEQEIE